MPMFKVNVTRTIVEQYNDIELEADDAEAAQELAEEMVKDDEVAIDSMDETFACKATAIEA